jgi:hypothetical protein
MVIRQREGLDFSISREVPVSGLPRNYGFTETQMEHGGTHGPGSIRKYITENEHFRKMCGSNVGTRGRGQENEAEGQSDERRCGDKIKITEFE